MIYQAPWTLTVYDAIGQIWGEKTKEEQASCWAVERRPHLGRCAQQSCTAAVALFFPSAIKLNPQTVLSCPAGTDQKIYISDRFIFTHFQWVGSLLSWAEIWFRRYHLICNTAHFVHLNDEWLIYRLVNKEAAISHALFMTVSMNQLYVVCHISQSRAKSLSGRQRCEAILSTPPILWVSWHLSIKNMGLCPFH